MKSQLITSDTPDGTRVYHQRTPRYEDDPYATGKKTYGTLGRSFRDPEFFYRRQQTTFWHLITKEDVGKRIGELCNIPVLVHVHIEEGQSGRHSIIVPIHEVYIAPQEEETFTLYQYPCDNT